MSPDGNLNPNLNPKPNPNPNPNPNLERVEEHLDPGGAHEGVTVEEDSALEGALRVGEQLVPANVAAVPVALSPQRLHDVRPQVLPHLVGIGGRVRLGMGIGFGFGFGFGLALGLGLGLAQVLAHPLVRWPAPVGEHGDCVPG